MKKTFLLLLLIIFSKAEAQTSASSLADSLFSIGKYAEAVSMYQKIKPATPEILIKMAQAFRAQGNYGKSLFQYESALAETENLPAAVSDYGKLLYHTKKFIKADSVFQVLTERFPKNPNFHYQLGLAKEQLDDTTAIDAFRKVVELNPSHQNAIYELAVYQFKQENNKQVEVLGKKALESYPENTRIIRLLGQNAMALRDYPLAVKRFEKLLALGENSEFVRENLGSAYFQLGDLEKALKNYQILIDLEPQHVNAHYFSGRIYNSLYKTKKAEASLKKALKLKKRGLTGMYHALGNTYKLKKKYGKAIDYFKLALEENPYNLRAQFDLAIAADEYYKDLQTRLNYYKIFIRKFKDFPNAKPFVAVAEYRIKELKKERFMNSSEKGN